MVVPFLELPMGQLSWALRLWLSLKTAGPTSRYSVSLEHLGFVASWVWSVVETSDKKNTSTQQYGLKQKCKLDHNLSNGWMCCWRSIFTALDKVFLDYELPYCPSRQLMKHIPRWSGRSGNLHIWQNESCLQSCFTNTRGGNLYTRICQAHLPVGLTDLRGLPWTTSL